MIKEIWIFNGAKGKFASAVFIDLKDAEKWISENKLSGMITLYPVNKSVYNWAIEKEFFSPKNELENSAEFIQKFTSASQEHYRYERGEKQ
ncbi:MAG TPA: hypothetical protein VKT28_09755 [Puia sp.]|nr:hypothetical protein [Puia sp.]